jgi:hypothetical protein
VLKSYFDRSGQEDAQFMTLTGIAATDDLWKEIEDTWLYVLHNHTPRAEYMHMIEAIPLRKEFAKDKGWNDEMVSGLVNQLISYLSNVPKDKYCQFASIVHMDAYRKLHSEHYQLDSPVDICVESCVEKVMHWYMFAYKAGLDFEEHYYFDQGEPFEAVFKAKVNREIKKAEQLGQHSIWSHITHIGEAPMRKTPGLQIADMFAWANNREAAKLSPRWQALALAMRTLMPTLWVTWDEKTLRQFYRPLKPQAI